MPCGHLRWMHFLLHMGKRRSLPSLHGARLPWDWGSLQKRISGKATSSPSQMALFGYNLDSVETRCVKRYGSASREISVQALSRLGASLTGEVLCWDSTIFVSVAVGFLEEGWLVLSSCVGRDLNPVCICTYRQVIREGWSAQRTSVL